MCPYVNKMCNALKLTPHCELLKHSFETHGILHYMVILQCININKISHLYPRYYLEAKVKMRIEQTLIQ